MAERNQSRSPNFKPRAAGGYVRPGLPAHVERTLRKEAGFGCARCGHPYIEYHHIIPYTEEHHFRPEDMVALCGNCHPAVSKFHLDRQYGIKQNPYNIREKQFRGALEYDKRDLVFKIGGNWFENVPYLIVYDGVPIISCSLDEGQTKVSMVLLDEYGSVVLRVDKNEVAFRIDDLWDFKYKHNFAEARYGPGKIALQIDFRKPEAIIRGRLWLGGNRANIGPNEVNLPGFNMKGSTLRNLPVGIALERSGVRRVG